MASAESPELPEALPPPAVCVDPLTEADAGIGGQAGALAESGLPVHLDSQLDDLRVAQQELLGQMREQAAMLEKMRALEEAIEDAARLEEMSRLLELEAAMELLNTMEDLKAAQLGKADEDALEGGDEEEDTPEEAAQKAELRARWAELKALQAELAGHGSNDEVSDDSPELEPARGPSSQKLVSAGGPSSAPESE